ncbi:UDP-glucose 4-epimerase GalE [Kineococcus gynurae]|uniref:UDP-glucose 4-epimerase n=1 Tax=Kineococcus gynurae TaxID=452979 RepID=A0ABV5LXQ3_9ACTN
MNRPWLLTGGAGYIGAHVAEVFAAAGREVVVVDNFCTSGPVEEVEGRLPAGTAVVALDLGDTAGLQEVMTRYEVGGIVHLAARKSPTESMTDPLLYTRDNVTGTASLVTAARAAGVGRIVFSSSCSVYGNPAAAVVEESAPYAPISPYGWSKTYGEHLMNAAAQAYGLQVVNLRYFNVAGTSSPALADRGAYNLIPLALAAITAGREPVIFGDDYPTPDGTCVRDYVHVVDLAEAHLRAALHLEQDAEAPPASTFNVGTGRGSSVREVLDELRVVSGIDFVPRVLERRPGDPASIVGSVAAIRRELGWQSRYSLHDMVSSAWEARLTRTG